MLAVRARARATRRRRRRRRRRRPRTAGRRRRSAASDADVLLERARADEALPGHARAAAAARSGDVHAVDGVDLDDRAAARRSASSASRAAASRRSGATLLRLIEPTGGRDRVRRPDVTAPRRRGAAAAAPAHADRLPGPVGSLNPRMTVGDLDRARALAIHGVARPQAARDARSHELLAARRAARRGRRALPARVLRRPAPAHRHRARARRCGRSSIVARRAGVGARRLDPGADPQPARDLQQDVRRSPTCSSRTTSRSSAHLRPRRRDVPRARSSSSRRPTSCTRAAAPVHAGAALGRPDARARPQAHAHRAHGRRAEPDRPAVAAAASAPAARSRRRSAPRSSRRLHDHGDDHCAACHFAGDAGPLRRPRPFRPDRRQVAANSRSSLARCMLGSVGRASFANGVCQTW